MIFYGTKGVHLKSEKVGGVKCSYCEQQASHTVSIFGRYVHLYWIPFCPIGKKGVSECNNCKRTLEPKEMDEKLKLAYQNVKSTAKTPVLHWSGMGLIGIIILATIYFSGQHKKDAILYINNPQVGDVYDYKSTDYYSLLKVTSVTEDSVFVATNKFEMERQSALHRIDKAENFNGIPYGIEKEELKELFESKKILDVDRD